MSDRRKILHASPYLCKEQDCIVNLFKNIRFFFIMILIYANFIHKYAFLLIIHLIMNIQSKFLYEKFLIKLRNNSHPPKIWFHFYSYVFYCFFEFLMYCIVFNFNLFLCFMSFTIWGIHQDQYWDKIDDNWLWIGKL